MVTKAEYIWIDGHIPTSKLRSKTKIIEGDEVTVLGFSKKAINELGKMN